MRNLLSSIVLSGMVLAVALSDFEAQAFELSLVGAGNSSTPKVQMNGVSSAGYSSKIAFGGGILIGFDLNFALELEVGGLYVGRHFTYPNSTSGTQEDSFNAYEIPVILRLVPLKYLTFGAGIYYAIPTGQDTYTVTPTGGSGTSSSASATTNFKSDFGAVGSIAVKVPLGIASCFLVDGRYYYGMTNGSQIAAETLKFRDIQLLAGINFDF